MRNFKSRPGVSLIELTVVISVGAMLIALAAVTFTRILRMRGSAQEHLERTTQTARLAEQFRRDVWSARSASEVEEPAKKLTLNEAANRRVEYEIIQGGLQRTAFEGDKAFTPNVFRLPGAEVLTFSSEGAQGSKVSLLIASLRPHPVEGEDPYGKRSRIVALLGRDHRTAAAPQEDAND